MNAAGSIITILSVAVALGMGVVVAILLRDERRRSDARVMALDALASRGDVANDPYAAFASETVDPTPVIEHRPLVIDESDATGGGELFVEPERESPWSRRFAIAGGLLAVLFAVVFGLRAIGSGGHAPAPAAAAAPQLELVSMRHALDHDTLTITGLVRNPKSAAPVSRLTATAFLFDQSGSFVTSGRAPLQLTTLAAGDESPFVIAIPVTTQIARYRISFRDDTGRVVAHVDRRDGAAVARNE